MTLADRDCIPCRGGIPALAAERVRELMQELDGWALNAAGHLERVCRFPDFARALSFTNRVGELAEEQNHHPDLHLAWGRCTVEIWTHKIDGLTESDFVFAAKVDRIAKHDQGAHGS